jgi:hypothetical protein
MRIQMRRHRTNLRKSFLSNTRSTGEAPGVLVAFNWAFMMLAQSQPFVGRDVAIRCKTLTCLGYLQRNASESKVEIAFTPSYTLTVAN